MAKKDDIKCSTAEETAKFYDDQREKHRPQREEREEKPSSTLGTRSGWGKNPPHMSILLALMLTSTTLATFANAASASDDHRGSGRASYTPPVEGGPSRTGGSGTR